jgi:hypothetical protein
MSVLSSTEVEEYEKEIGDNMNLLIQLRQLFFGGPLLKHLDINVGYVRTRS